MNLNFAEDFRKNLLNWFSQNARSLPWRTDPNLYKTILSEFMLQQTQVKTVLPFFKKWLTQFPDFETLAEADFEEVLHCWAGLGYYSRAKNLHQLAKAILTQPPKNSNDLIKYKGIGAYTAAAIASIAFNEPIVVVDGNVIRVLSRIFNHTDVFNSKDASIKWCTPLAQELLDKKQPGNFNEAIMELGALVCTKNSPDCANCPLKTFCLASQNNTIDLCPQFVQPKRIKQIKKRLLLCYNGQIFLEKSKIGNLLELPELTDEMYSLVHSQLVFTGKRSISTTDYTEEIYKIENKDASSFKQTDLPNCTFFSIEALDALSLSGPHKRWIKNIFKED